MLTPAEFSVRRSVYSAFLALAVLGPVVTVVFALAGARSHWIEIISAFATLLGIPLLCVWCAIYIRDEPKLARIALIWIALLFLFLLGVLVTHPIMH